MVHLDSMQKRKDLVFLLGAGSVQDAGLPTAVGLTKCVEESINNNFPNLLPVLRFVYGALQFGKACQGEGSTNKINIEELLTACSFLATRNKSEIYPFVGAWHELINTHQVLPKGVISNETSDSFHFLANYCKLGLRDWLSIKDSTLLKYLWSFRDFINAGYQLRIFTLNYDECIECALTESLSQVNERWTTGFDEKGWNPSLLDDNKYDAYLYKLHGSLDWVKDQRLGICSVKWPAAEESEEIPEEFDPLLVFGINVKLQAIDPFLTLLFRFQQLLNSSEVLVIIGYSFGDDHINSMILDSLQRDPRKRCIIVNPGGIETLLPQDSDFRRLVAVEQRFY
jgi:hypothetical protein